MSRTVSIFKYFFNPTSNFRILISCDCKDLNMSVQKFVIGKKTGVGFTSIPNNVLQGLKNYAALGLYVYLASLPPGWEFHKDHLAKHANIGRDKINSLLKILEGHHLVRIAQIRDAQGRFAHFSMDIDDGTSFKINEIENAAQPFTEKPLTANQLLVNRSYKGNINKENKEHKENISCASDDAHAPTLSFNLFWEAYPKKRDRARALRIWRQKKFSDEKIKMLMDDLQVRKKTDTQWEDKQFIPYATRYLDEELWNDEIVVSMHKQEKLVMNKNTDIHSTVPFLDVDKLYCGYERGKRETAIETIASIRRNLKGTIDHGRSFGERTGAC